MTKSEFIRELEDALRGNVSSQVLKDNVDYYRSYITEQEAAGIPAEDVIAGLGSPRLIAKTIIDTSKAAGEDYRESAGEEEHRQWSMAWIMDNVRDSWVWKICAVILAVIVIYVIFKVFFAIVGFLIRPAIVIVAIAIVCYVVKNIMDNNKH